MNAETLPHQIGCGQEKLEDSKNTLQVHCVSGLTERRFWTVDNQHTVADKIAWLMNELDCATQKAFADRIGVSLDAVNRWVNESRPPNRTNQNAIAKAMDVRPSLIYAFFEQGVLPVASNKQQLDTSAQALFAAIDAALDTQPTPVQDWIIERLTRRRARAGPPADKAVSGK